MHPIEHLRHLARFSGSDPSALAQEAAYALAALAREDPAGLLPACRRLVERHLVCGPLWWLSALMLRSDDPGETAKQAIAELDADSTASQLSSAIPEDCTVLVVGLEERDSAALRRRGDLEVLACEAAIRLRGDETEVPDSGVGPAAACAGLVVLEACCAGGSGALCAPGSLAAAAVASFFEKPVWLLAGVGRVLPEDLWGALLGRFDGGWDPAGRAGGREPWQREAELVPASLITAVVGPLGLVDTASGLGSATCPPAPELASVALGGGCQ
jgi:hypothetical protein